MITPRVTSLLFSFSYCCYVGAWACYWRDIASRSRIDDVNIFRLKRISLNNPIYRSSLYQSVRLQLLVRRKYIQKRQMLKRYLLCSNPILNWQPGIYIISSHKHFSSNQFVRFLFCLYFRFFRNVAQDLVNRLRSLPTPKAQNNSVEKRQVRSSIESIPFLYLIYRFIYFIGSFFILWSFSVWNDGAQEREEDSSYFPLK